MKKTLAILMALVMVLGACTFASAEVKTYKVGISIYQYTDNFMTLYRNEIAAYFKTLETDEVKYELVFADAKNDMAEQTNQMNNFVTQGMDVIILNPVQTSSADVLIDIAVSNEIPLVLINREPLAYDADGNTLDEAYEGILNNPKVCYVGADARQSGTYQGELILATANQGDINGDGKISYIMIQGDPENIDAQYRTEFSVKALTDAGKTVNCLDSQVGNWDQTKGQELCANALTVYGYDVEVVFCNNDGMALGAAAAIEKHGRKVGEDIYLLGVDALTDAGVEVKELVKNVGNWDQTKGQEIVAAALAQYGDDIEVVFCNNDGMALGAYAAITAAGRKVGEDIYLLGVDALAECQEMVQNGEMTGTVLNDHIGQSHAAVDAAVAALKGEALQNYYWVDYVKVDASYFG